MPCKTVKLFLDRKNVEYCEKDIEIEENLKEMVEKTGFTSVPVTIIDEMPILGANLSAISSLLTK